VIVEIFDAVRPDQYGTNNVPVLYDRPATVDELMQQLCSVDMVVATRFHTVLIALKLAKPTVAIAYGHKYVALMASMGVGQPLQNIKEIDVEALERQLEAL
jgi:polysaccharide pyruvyl transferase WcaK-like protein